MYECEVFEYGETKDCKNKADCLEVMVSAMNLFENYKILMIKKVIIEDVFAQQFKRI